MAKTKAAWTTVTVNPLSGVLDTRTNPEQVAIGAWRWLEGMRFKDGSKLCCREGFEKAFNTLNPYVNSDLHDQTYLNASSQLTAVTQEHITFMFSATSNDGTRTLYASTLNRIYVLNESAGTWSAIATFNQAEENGCSQQRFQADELEQVVIFTDNVNQPLYTAVGSTTSGQIGELAIIQVTAAGVVVEFGGFMLLMNVVQAGARMSSRIWWSNYQGPTQWNPAGMYGPVGAQTASLANYQDLDYGAQILAAVGVGGLLYIYTTESIWTCSPTGDTSVFAFQKVYTDPLNHSRCLVYPNTLVASGTDMYYVSQESVYNYNPYIPQPQRLEWMYRGGSIMFSDTYGLDPNCCQSPVAAIVPEETEIYLSWPELNKGTGCANTKTLVFNYLYGTVSIYSHGFSAFVNFRPQQATTSGCNIATQYFLGASCQDLCLKNIGVNFSQEICTNPGGTGTLVNGVLVPSTGVYTTQGYYRIMRALLPFENFDRDKWVRRLLLECHPNPNTPQCVMRLRVGNSFSETDPNKPDGLCSVLWHQMKDLPLKCLDTMTGPQYVAANLRRDSGTEWNFLQAGRFVYVEFTVANPDDSPAIGGDCCFTRMELKVQVQTT